MTNVTALAISDGEENCNLFEQQLLDADLPMQVESVGYFTPGSDIDDYDILLILDSSENLTYAKQVTASLRESKSDAQVFIVSDLENPRVLHTLLSMRVDGYVDTQDWDFEAVASAIRSIATFKAQAEQVSEKLTKLQRYML